MNYRREIYYQEKEGVPHRKVSQGELESLIGKTLSSFLLSKGEYRMEQDQEFGSSNTETELQIKAFHDGSLASVVAVASLTSKGNVFVQYVAV